jgi:hypothetical protein
VIPLIGIDDAVSRRVLDGKKNVIDFVASTDVEQRLPPDVLSQYE